MSKVYSLHMIALKAGASGPDFERFFHEGIEPVRVLAVSPCGCSEAIAATARASTY